MALLILPWALGSAHFTLVAFVVVYGLDWVATVPPTVALASREFGIARGPLVFGWVFTAHQIGAAFAAYAAGLSRTIMGDYVFVFNAAAMLCMVAALAALRIGMPSLLPGGTHNPRLLATDRLRRWLGGNGCKTEQAALSQSGLFC